MVEDIGICRAEGARVAVVAYRIIPMVSMMALVSGWASAAKAQTAETATTTGIQDIVVTAQRRDQRLQDVPIAITALTNQSLEANRVRSVVDLNALAPGFNARMNAGGNGNVTFIMRGVFAAGSLAGADKQVSTYVDGVYIGGSRASAFDFPDIERIEVLRGPQGTLFGRNSTAGAISVVTRNPTGEFKVRQDVSFGNYAQFRTRTTVDLPAFGPFSAYVSYVHDERDGDIKNAGAGIIFDRTSPFSKIGVQRSAERLGGRNHNQIFAALRFQPADNLTSTLKFDRARERAVGNGRSLAAINPDSAVGNLVLQIIAAQPADSPFGPVITTPSFKRPKVVNNGFNVPGYQHNSGFSLTTEWRPADNLVIKNITAHRWASIYTSTSVDGLPTLIFTPAAAAAYAAFTRQPIEDFASLIGGRFQTYGLTNYSRGSQWSSEIQANYNSDFMTLTIGGLYYRANERVGGLPGMREKFQYSPIGFTQLPLGSITAQYATSKSMAAYAQGEFHITPHIDAIIGGRITNDRKNGRQESGGVYVPATPGDRADGVLTGVNIIPDGGFRFRDTRPTYSIGMNYKPNSDLLFYGKYATGFMSGGSIAGEDFAPETVSSFELGAKADLLGRRLRVNAALFHAKYKHAQSSQAGSNVGRPDVPLVIVDNGELRAKGFELEVTAMPVRGLTLGGGIGYTDLSASNADPRLIASFGGTRYEPTGIPKWAGNAYAQYDTNPLIGDAYMTFRLDMQFRSKFRSDPNPDVEVDRPIFANYEFVDAQQVVNGRIALSDINLAFTQASIAVWARNLFDDKTANYTVGFGDIYKTTDWQPARTFGVDLSVTF